MSGKKLAVYIGRFQPFHNGHKYVVNEALKIADEVLILVGSANASLSTKNPFTYEERRDLIYSEYTTIPWEPIVEALDDFLYEETQWNTEVQSLIQKYEHNDHSVVIVGHTKDDSSYYLKNFPQYDYVEVENFDIIDAKHIRELLYTSKFSFLKGVVGDNVHKKLVDFSSTKAYNILVDEYNYIEKYKKSWAGSPYTPIFQTVDAIVIQSGHILLVKRGRDRGIGLWALPGGFLNSEETLLTGCIRELREETKLKVPVPVLKGSITNTRTFDAVGRSNLGRIITTAFLIQLDDSQELPKVKGGDDADEAKWVTLSEFYNMPESMFSDHYHIARKMVDNI